MTYNNLGNIQPINGMYDNVDYSVDEHGVVTTTITTTNQGHVYYDDSGSIATALHIDIGLVKSNFSAEELIDAYGIEEFERVIRERKIKRIMGNDG